MLHIQKMTTTQLKQTEKRVGSGATMLLEKGPLCSIPPHQHHFDIPIKQNYPQIYFLHWVHESCYTIYWVHESGYTTYSLSKPG